MRSAAAAALGAVLTAGGCQTDAGPSSCQLQQQAAQDGSPLTLLSNARLDRVGDHFMLIGYDGQRVRWATVDLSGGLGPQHDAAIPTPLMGPWFAVAGASAPGDAILIAYGAPSAKADSVDIALLTVPADGSGPAAAAGTPLTVPASGAIGAPAVALGSGRTGMRAGLAWAIPGEAQVNAQLLGGDGLPFGPPITHMTAAPTVEVSCLSFVAGKQDLTLGFVTQAAPADANPGWTLSELDESGAAAPSLGLTLGTANPTCPLTATTDAGYVVAWQNEIGSWLGVYTVATNLFNSNLFAGAVTFGGPDLQPPLAGLAPVAGGDFAVVLARAGAAEAWRIAAAGNRQPGSVVFPSALGQMGEVSAVPQGGSLYATYADYTSTGAQSPAGQRFFVKVGCF